MKIRVGRERGIAIEFVQLTTTVHAQYSECFTYIGPSAQASRHLLGNLELMPHITALITFQS